MNKSDIIELLLKGIRTKMNRMKKEDLESLMGRHPWISRKKGALKK